MCSNSGTASTFTTSNQIGEIHVFDVKFGLRHVAWHNGVHGSMNTDEKSNGSSKEVLEKCKYLRNEFNFSGVHGAMNRSGSRAK